MELIIGFIIIAAVIYFVFFRKKEEESVYAPYKVETPAPVAETKVETPAPVVESAPVATSGLVGATEASGKKELKCSSSDSEKLISSTSSLIPFKV